MSTDYIRFYKNQHRNAFLALVGRRRIEKRRRANYFLFLLQYPRYSAYNFKSRALKFQLKNN